MRRSIMHQGRRVARRGGIGRIRQPLAALQCPGCYRLTGLGRGQVWVVLVHLMVVFPINKKIYI